MTLKNISLSIIMPAYNEENRLPETLNMFIEWKKQNSDLNIELIIVNDGSIDKTNDIALSFHHNYSWIKLINEKHVGMMNAIISGIHCAQYDLIGTLEDTYLIANNRIGNSNEPIIVLPPKEKESIFDIIFSKVKTNTSFNLIYPVPQFRLIY